MSINPGYKTKESPNAWRYAIALFIIMIGIMCLLLYMLGQKNQPVKPYALKQNGDTLFIPTQVLVKHDTLVVIRTEERRPVADSLNRLSFKVSGVTTYAGGWTTEQVKAYFINGQKPYKQRDTIYEHKIIYY